MEPSGPVQACNEIALPCLLYQRKSPSLEVWQIHSDTCCICKRICTCLHFLLPKSCKENI